jgi:tetratricopeptide (TPR) repeat protein
LAEVHAQFAFWWIDATPQRLALADAAIGHAVRLAPDSPDVIRSLGTYAYYAYRDYARATEQYEKIARLQPNDPTVALSLGLILRRQGHWAESLVYLRKAVELDPGNVNGVRSLLQSFYSGRHYDEYIAAQRRLMLLLPEHQLRQQLGLFTGQMRAFDSTSEAEAWLAGLTSEQREQPRVIDFRKFLAAWKDDYAEFRRLDSQQPFFDEDGFEHYDQAESAAEIYATHGDMTAARARLAGFPEELRARIEREPGNARLTCELGLIEALLGHADEAVRLARHGVDLVPESRDALDGPNLVNFLADVYAWTGHKDQAMDLLSHLVRVPCSYMSLPLLRHDFMLTPLRGDPRFEALLNDPKNKAPLF